MKYPAIDGYVFEVGEPDPQVPGGLRFRLLDDDGGVVHHALAQFQRPDGAARSVYGIQCRIMALTGDGNVQLRTTGKPLEVAATAAAPKTDDPARAATQAIELKETALDRAVRELLREIGVEAANRAAGII